MRRLENDGVDAVEGRVVQERLVPQPDHDSPEELTHLRMGLADQHPRHA